MLRLISWILMAPLALVVITFSISNREAIVLNLWPLDVSTIPIPVFTVVLVSILVGFLWGGIVSWLSAGKFRSKARTLGYQVEAEKWENKRLAEKLEKLESENRKAAQVAQAAPAPSSAPALEAPKEANAA